MKSFGVTPLIVLNIWCRTETSDVKLSIAERNFCEARRNAATELHRKLRKGTATSGTDATISLFSPPKTLLRTNWSH